MKRTTVAMLMIFAMLGTALVGCAQAADKENGNVGESENTVSLTENTALEEPDTDSGNEQENPTLGESTEQPADSHIPVVYMTTDISADGLMAIYEVLGGLPGRQDCSETQHWRARQQLSPHGSDW